MRMIVIVILAFLLDLILGDPVWLYHPVRIIGLLISGLERILRKAAGESEKGLLFAGSLLWILVSSISFWASKGLLFLAGAVHPVLALPWRYSGVTSFWRQLPLRRRV